MPPLDLGGRPRRAPHRLDRPPRDRPHSRWAPARLDRPWPPGVGLGGGADLLARAPII